MDFLVFANDHQTTMSRYVPETSLSLFVDFGNEISKQLHVVIQVYDD